MPTFDPLEIWFLTGSQHLYGPETLRQVAANSTALVKALNDASTLPINLVFKPVLKTPEEIRALCQDASHADTCAGVILWMHTFSPAKMWINGLKALAKPFLHLHTQFNRDLPWSTIDMDFMNLNQAAHGDREAGHLHTRMRLSRKVVVGHFSDKETQGEIATWTRAAAAWHDLQGMKVARIGDNMRHVAVTEGNKVSAEQKFGFSVNTHGVGDVVKYVNAISDADTKKLLKTYADAYALTSETKSHPHLYEAAKQELGLRAFLTEGNFKAFTTTFEDLHGLHQLPGLASQRLMADGYGFGAEGDWKTAALLRASKTMAKGLRGGTSFMEDYTYHLDPKNSLVLGSHMLEICPTIATAKPSLQIHALGIGGKADPARLVFDAPAGPALNASLIDLGNRFRLLVNEVAAIKPPKPLPKLPVARAVWKPLPTFKTALAAWIHAGGAHHTVYSYPLTTEHFRDLANIANVELATINNDTKDIPTFQQSLRTNELYYHLAPGLGHL